MKILFMTIARIDNMETQGIYTDLMKHFEKNGHEIFIASANERRYLEKTNISIYGNIKNLKVKVGNIIKCGMIEKGFSTILINFQYKKAIKKYFKNIKFDLIIYATPPITLLGTIKYFKSKYDAKTYLLLKDIFPQNAVDLNLLEKKGIKGIVYKYFRKKEKQLYRVSDKIGCMSQANVEYVLGENTEISKEKVEICPNSIKPLNINITAKEKYEIRERYNIPNDKKVFIYGGNLGKPQSVDFVIKCIEKNEINLDSYIVIIGSGTEYAKVEKAFKQNKYKNAVLFSIIPRSDYETLVNSCDVGLIFLDKKFSIPNFPSRLLSYMQAGIPIVAATDKNTDIGEIIEKNNFGFWCESSDVEKFNEIIVKICNSDLKKMGERSYQFLKHNYTVDKSYDIIMKNFKI